jgi:hypothetical protein
VIERSEPTLRQSVWVQQRTNRHITLETLTRMSRKDLSDLMHAVLDAKTKPAEQGNQVAAE